MLGVVSEMPKYSARQALLWQLIAKIGKEDSPYMQEGRLLSKWDSREIYRYIDRLILSEFTRLVVRSVGRSVDPSFLGS